MAGEKGESGGKEQDGTDAPGFESLMVAAEELAARMEDGGLTLEQALAAYEKGVENLRRAAGLLRTAEERVKILTEKNGAFRLDDPDWNDTGKAGGNGGEDE
ncbi:MAG: exodeoxyribonuclease VII small subunit [Planctomycetota bacterium]|jgi:exodeoxyribonuclease VII small subunit|nr:exodeoxyribonuclease VII small subunit [Planctomycetota bacterium]